MANRDLLADAIADAKAVKEVAIANAKAALEEAFTPHLKDMLAQKINEMDELEETDLAEVDKEKVDEEKEMDEGYGKKEMDEAEDKMDEAENMDEELDLEEILAELELDEEEEDLPPPPEEAGGPGGFAVNEEEEAGEEEVELEAGEVETDDSEEEINLEEMSEEELKELIEDVIEDMVASGELEAGGDKVEMSGEEGEEAEGEEAEGEEAEDEGEETEEETGEEELSEAYIDDTKQTKFLSKAEMEKKIKAGDYDPSLMDKIWDFLSEAESEDKEELEEAKAAIKYLRSELNEVNLLNSKLLYTNKIFRGKNLTENQKIKVLKAFDKAETVREAKAIFETLNENLVSKSTKSPIRESLGAASKPAGVAPKRTLNEGIVQEDAMVKRFKQLAGLK